MLSVAPWNKSYFDKPLYRSRTFGTLLLPQSIISASAIHIENKDKQISLEENEEEEKETAVVKILDSLPLRTIKDDVELKLPLPATEPLPIGKRKTKKKTKEMCWDSYHTFETIVHYLHSMKKKYPKLVELFVIGHTCEKRPIIVIRISEDIVGSNKIFVEGGIHAREWISPASVTFIINKMLRNWSILPHHVKNKTWLFLPVLNPDGYVYTWKHERLWRKNRSKQPCSDSYGVDLNRNFSIGWRYNPRSNPSHINYKGTEPFSERETCALKNFLTTNKRNLKAYITFHSYAQQIRFLLERDDSEFDRQRVYEVAHLAANNMRMAHGTPYSVKGLPPRRALVGNSKDWAKITFKLRYSFAVELRDRGEFGFLLPEEEIYPTAIEAWSFVKTISNAIEEDVNEKLSRIRNSIESH